MRTSHENPTIVKGKGIGHRRLSGDDGADLVLDFWTCVKHLDQPSLQQALALVPGVSRAAVYKARARRNENNGGNGGSGDNGAAANPPSPATLAADLIKTVGFDTALDLLVQIDGGNNGG
jgi:hypothetical protein